MGTGGGNCTAVFGSGSPTDTCTARGVCPPAARVQAATCFYIGKVFAIALLIIGIIFLVRAALCRSGSWALPLCGGHVRRSDARARTRTLTLPPHRG